LLSDAKRKKFYHHLYKDTNDSQSEMVQEYNKYKDMKNGNNILNSGLNTELNNYEKLQRDVTKLEYEVQNFLDLLRSRRLEADIN
jgi:hypothetical protein